MDPKNDFEILIIFYKKSSMDKSISHKFLFECIVINREDNYKDVKDIFDLYTREKRVVECVKVKKKVKINGEEVSTALKKLEATNFKF